MRNKEIKVGDTIWMYYGDCSYSRDLTVIKVKKKGTLVTVVVDASFDKPYEVTLYGHVSSNILSGFDRRFTGYGHYYTCDYDYLEGLQEKSRKYDQHKEIGRALLNLVSLLKDKV